MNPRHCQLAASFLLGIAILRGVSAQTPSFDCAKATTLRERTVCASPRLSEQDTQIAAAYKAELARLSAASAALVRSDQREWLQWLDHVCSSHSAYNDNIANCLQSQYFSRLSQLREGPSGPDVPAFYTRASFVLVQPKQAGQERLADNDPGFGTGEFSWPQIDKPTPAQAAWNHAILAAAIQTTADKDTNPTPAAFASSVDPSGTVSVSVVIVAANDRLIVAKIVDSIYGYGAAHPNTSDSYVSWWLDAGRELTANDVFRADTKDWPARLVPLFYEKLKPDLVENDELWSAANVQKSIAAELSNPQSWSITHEGFTLHCGQYEVGPYSSGMPFATLAWKDLEPYLASTLHPETLPPPHPEPNR